MTEAHVAEMPLLLTVNEAARLCNTSERTWRTWDALGHVPRPVVVGRSKFWRPAEIRAWVAHGCPDRQAWDAVTEGKTF